MQKLVLYFQESYDELRTKVTWPTWTDLLATAGLVLVSSLIISGIVFGMDTVISQIIRLVFYR